MSSLSNILLTEATITDKITSRANITFDALIHGVLELKDEKVTKNNIKELASILDIKVPTLTKYVELATKSKFLNKDGSVPTKYNKSVQGKVKSSSKVSQVLDSKIKKFKAPKVAKNNLFSDQVFKMLSLMDGQAAQSGVKNSLMLTGDPGVGKTSFIRSFAKLLGLPLIPIEAPHITEEHIINIPFMIIKGNQVKKENATIEIAGNHTLEDDAQSFDIVQAESNLVTKLKAMKNEKLKDKEHLKLVAADKNLRPILMNYISLIDKIRDSYHCILFLDEYYRNDNMKIRNILRNILNGRIGNDKIPKGTFIVYASNMDDDGVEDIPMNNDFAEMEFKSPDKEQWFKYILNTYEENSNNDYPGVKLNPKVFNKFYDTIKKEELSFEDEESEVRSSPRRWEQILLYVNASLPVANVKEAKLLMSNLKVNFTNYIEGTTSPLYPKIQQMVVELIKETSNVDFDGSATSPVEWKDTLQQQLEVKMKLDGDATAKKEVRQYVPVVSGAPGIGKTAHMSTVADNLDLHFIHIDVSTLTRESTTGIPKASQALDDNGVPVVDQNGNPVMTTEFSKPELLDLIEKKMQEELDADAVFPESERKKGKGKYKFLLLFDELTRADAQVFNAIRKLLLEKSFNESYDLPDSIMTVGALNPTDNGVTDLTKHMRDVLDIIPAGSSWAKTEKYLLSTERPDGLEEEMGFDLNTATVNALKLLLTQYQSREGDVDMNDNPIPKEERLFNLKEDANIIYISPREMTDIVTMTNTNIVNRLVKTGLLTTVNTLEDDTNDNMDDDDFMAALQAKRNRSDQEKSAQDLTFDKHNNYDDADYDHFIKAMLVEFRDVWASKLSFICKKQETDAANILSVTTGFIMKNDQIYDQYDAIKTMNVKEAKSISEMFNAYYDNPEELYDSPHFDNYLTENFAAPQKFTQEITDFVTDKQAEISQIDGSLQVNYTNANGETIQRPKIDDEKVKFYKKYLAFTTVILKILTQKSQYATKTKEAERTGQYLSNLYMQLKQIGQQFQVDIMPYLYDPLPGKENKLDSQLKTELLTQFNEIKELFTSAGITVRNVQSVRK